MICPVCETPCPDDVAECATCGKVLLLEGVLEDEVEQVPGLEQTLVDAVDVPVERLEGVELTQLVGRNVPVLPDTSVQVEHTQLEEDPAAPRFWSIQGLDLDAGREADDGARTPEPEDTGTCPWCGSPSTDALCDGCGRRRSRYAKAPATLPPEATTDERVLCPACFAKVPPGPRCVECGVPFPVPEL